MSIGNKLKKLRVERGLTQQTVADALGISRSVYSQYENNEREPSLRSMERLVAADGSADVLTTVVSL